MAGTFISLTRTNDICFHYIIVVLDDTFISGLTSRFKSFFLGKWLARAIITIKIDIYA